MAPSWSVLDRRVVDDADNLALLRWATLALFFTTLAHGADHLLGQAPRPFDSRFEITVMGTLINLAAFTAIGFSWLRLPRAPQVAATCGFVAALLTVAVHIAPHWSAFSDSYWDLSVNAISWVIMLGLIGAAFATGVIGTLVAVTTRANESWRFG